MRWHWGVPTTLRAADNALPVNRTRFALLSAFVKIFGSRRLVAPELRMALTEIMDSISVLSSSPIARSNGFKTNRKPLEGDSFFGFTFAAGLVAESVVPLRKYVFVIVPASGRV